MTADIVEFISFQWVLAIFSPATILKVFGIEILQPFVLLFLNVLLLIKHIWLSLLTEKYTITKISIKQNLGGNKDKITLVNNIVLLI